MVIGGETRLCQSVGLVLGHRHIDGQPRVDSRGHLLHQGNLGAENLKRLVDSGRRLNLAVQIVHDKRFDLLDRLRLARDASLSQLPRL